HCFLKASKTKPIAFLLSFRGFFGRAVLPWQARLSVPATVAIAPGLNANDLNAETTLTLDLTLQPLKQRTLKLLDPSAFQAGEVEMVAGRCRFVEVFLPFEVHQVEFVHEALTFQHGQRAIDGGLVEPGITKSSLLPEVKHIHVAVGSLHDLYQDA